MISTKGIFISDAAREQLLLNISPEEFQKLKEEVNKAPNPEEKMKCYLTEQYYPLKDGIYFPPEKMADAIEANLAKAEELERLYVHENIIVCTCGVKFRPISNVALCPTCKKQINCNKHYKTIRLSDFKKTSFRLYIKQLRRNVAKANQSISQETQTQS